MSDAGEFWLYDLKVETVLDGRIPVCRHVDGEYFTVEGENLVFAQDQRMSMYALAAILPLLPAKQRELITCRRKPRSNACILGFLFRNLAIRLTADRLLRQRGDGGYGRTKFPHREDQGNGQKQRPSPTDSEGLHFALQLLPAGGHLGQPRPNPA